MRGSIVRINYRNLNCVMGSAESRVVHIGVSQLILYPERFLVYKASICQILRRSRVDKL